MTPISREMYISSVNPFVLFCFLKTQMAVLAITNDEKTEVINAVEKYVKVLPVEEYRGENRPKYVSRFFRSIAIKCPNENIVREQNVSETEQLTYEYVSDVYAYNGAVDKDKLSTSVDNVVDRLNILFITASCEFGRWIKNKLYNIIRIMPVLYHTVFIDSEYDHEFENNYEEIDKDLNGIADNIDRFIHILYTLVNAEPFTVSSNENTILRASYALKFKIVYLKSLHARDGKRTDELVVRECLDVINEVQSFTLSNCPSAKVDSDGRAANDTQRLYGYGINLAMFNRLDEFFEQIACLKLEYESRKRCTAEQILLRSILKDGDGSDSVNNVESENVPKYCIARAINGSTITLADEEGGMTVNTIYSLLEKSYAIEVLYFYQKSVLNVVMSIMHSVIKSSLTECTQDALDGVKRFITKTRNDMKPTIEKFPKTLTDYFDVSVDFTVTSDRLLNDLESNAADRHSTVQLPVWVSRISLGELEEFVVKIIENANDFECFNEVFEFLSVECELYYVPFIAQSNVRRHIRPTENRYIFSKTINNSNECDYVDSMYSLIVETTFTLNNITSYELGADERKRYVNSAKRKFQRIEMFYSVILDIGLRDHDILKIAYGALINVVNTKLVDENDRWHNVERTLFLFMTDLNGYAIKYCTSSSERLGLLLHQNLNIFGIGKLSATKKTITKLSRAPPSSLNDQRSFLDHSQFDLTFLFDNYVRNTKVFDVYENIIMYYWKGEKKTFKQMYGHATSSITLNARFLYAFYDGFFKFYVAAFYYEVNEFFSKIRDNMTLQAKRADLNIELFTKTASSLSEMYFPQTLRPFIIKLKRFALRIVEPNSTPDRIAYQESVSSQLRSELNTFFIVFENNPKNEANGNCFNQLLSVFAEKKNHLQYIIKDISDSVKLVFEHYKKLHEYDESEKLSIEEQLILGIN